MNQMTASATIDQLRLESLLETVQGASSVLILTHNDPDPDSIASAVALQYILETLTGVSTVIAYGGIVGRAENRALVEYLALDMQLASGLDWTEFELVACGGLAPGAGNNALPAGRRADIVIDHHQPFREQSSLASHADIRLEIGASSTILTGYVLAAGLDISPRLATALFYGIQTDTMGLSRDANDLDGTSYAALQPLVDVEALNTIERARCHVSISGPFPKRWRTRKCTIARWSLRTWGTCTVPIWRRKSPMCWCACRMPSGCCVVASTPAC